MNKNIIWGVVIVAVLAGIGWYMFSDSPEVEQLGAGSAVGTTFNTAKIAGITMAPATAAASSTSLLNPDSTDRVVRSASAYCTGVGTSQTYLTGAGLLSTGWTLNMATTSTAAQTGSTNYVASITLATTTGYVYSATSTTPAIGDVTRLWPAGSYLTLTFNATNTAACIAEVDYLSS